MAQLYVNAALTALGPSDTYYLAGVEDANGHVAVGYTEFVQLPSGLLLVKRTDTGGIPLSVTRVTSTLTTTALAASAPYTQDWQDAQALAVTYVAGSVTADQAGSLVVNFSDDGATVAKTTTLLPFVPTAAGTANAQAIPYPVQIPTRYFQFVYTNGSVAQGTFALYQTPLSDWSPRDVGLTGSLVPQTLSPTPAPLAASATYTSDNLSMGSYDKIVGSVYADQTGNLYVNQSYDGKNWDVQSTVTVSASTPTGFNIAVVAPYQQIVYTNGSTAQSTFRLNVGGKTL